MGVLSLADLHFLIEFWTQCGPVTSLMVEIENQELIFLEPFLGSPLKTDCLTLGLSVRLGTAGK